MIYSFDSFGSGFTSAPNPFWYTNNITQFIRKLLLSPDRKFQASYAGYFGLYQEFLMPGFGFDQCNPSLPSVTASPLLIKPAGKHRKVLRRSIP